MKLFDTLAFAYDSPALLRRMGLNKWLFCPRDNSLHLETGKPDAEAGRISLTVQQMAAMMSPEDVKTIKAHWGSILAQGSAGPERLPFLLQDGERTIVESTGSLTYSGQDTLLVGYYRLYEEDARLMKRTRLLSEFLQSFVQNSPSCIMVFDASGTVINANEALKRFMMLADPKQVIGRKLDQLNEISDRKFISVIKAALANPASCEGKHVMLHRDGTHQTVYWRCFSLSTQDESVRTRVLSFNHHASGPMRTTG